MRFAIFFFVLLISTAAQPLSPEEGARFDREEKVTFDRAAQKLLRGADSIVVRSLLPPIEGAADTATISDGRVVRSLVKKIKAAKSMGPWVRLKDGVIISETFGIPCQCWGEFEVQFFKEKKLLGAFTLHHWTHIRSDALTSGADVPLEPSSMDELYEAACAALPEFGARLKKPNKRTTDKPAIREARHNWGSGGVGN